ncbi:MAG: hypothetical protein FWG47_07950 [Propionibacteriaceae bacterium]|nr:hypothetical protein [Propionibacteriaceae bacterium]
MPVNFDYYHALGYWHISQMAVLIIAIIVTVALLHRRIVSRGSLILRLIPLVLILGVFMNIDMWMNEGVGNPEPEYDTSEYDLFGDISVHYSFLGFVAGIGLIAVLLSLWVRRRRRKRQQLNKGNQLILVD